jgi:hypothetical protein
VGPGIDLAFFAMTFAFFAFNSGLGAFCVERIGRRGGQPSNGVWSAYSLTRRA